MPDPGDVVIADFVGAMGVKRRPAVVVSSQLYHQYRPDIVLAVMTTQPVTNLSPTDYILQDWNAAGLHQSSTFRAFFNMASPQSVQVSGHLSDRDWLEVQQCLMLALAT